MMHELFEDLFEDGQKATYEEKDDRLSQAIRDKNSLGLFITSTGWKRIDSILEEKEQLLLSNFLDTAIEMSATTLSHYRYALQSIRMFRKLPELLLDEAAFVIGQSRDFDEDTTDGALPPFGEGMSVP